MSSIHLQNKQYTPKILRLLKVLPVKFSILAVFFKKLKVCPFLGDFSIFNKVYDICILYCRKPMSNNNTCATFH